MLAYDEKWVRLLVSGRSSRAAVPSADEPGQLSWVGRNVEIPRTEYSGQ
jgi:hypothetical protein